MSKQIRILKDGPYIVSGNIPLKEKVIVEEDGIMVLKEVRTFETGETYALCRCGQSKNMPFCDGTHELVNFDGTETASKEPYLDRAELLEGYDIDLLDDGRCAYARFCHKHRGDVWSLTEDSNDPENKKEAIQAANDCPTGRLTIRKKDGELIEPDLPQEISILQDKEEGTSAGIFVSGNIPLFSDDGTQYELRNRMTLCRCGASMNKPFCDAIHINIEFDDEID